MNSLYFAQAYGEGAYSSCTFGAQNCQTTQPSATPQQPGVPNTGLWQQPFFLVPALLIFAVIIVAIEMTIRRVLKRRKANKA